MKKMTIDVKGKEIEVTEQNAQEVIKNLKGMFFDEFDDEESDKIAEAILAVDNCFAKKLPGTIKLV